MVITGQFKETFLHSTIATTLFCRIQGGRSGILHTIFSLQLNVKLCSLPQTLAIGIPTSPSGASHHTPRGQCSAHNTQTYGNIDPRCNRNLFLNQKHNNLNPVIALCHQKFQVRKEQKATGTNNSNEHHNINHGRSRSITRRNLKGIR
ncbi:hypothetical protein V8G54_012912 [Vigna mungo]|uniref:Uncharacterized protein n=1 Tax=Vigna mungo TaxID=3915 RepID=A0AAQ3S4B2_VIGMU